MSLPPWLRTGNYITFKGETFQIMGVTEKVHCRRSEPGQPIYLGEKRIFSIEEVINNWEPTHPLGLTRFERKDLILWLSK